MAHTQIIIVNGFDPSDLRNAEEAAAFPWIDLCLRQIARHTRGAAYEVRVHDNALLPSHRRVFRRYPAVHVSPSAPVAWLARRLPQVERRCVLSHPDALQRLARSLPPDVEYIVTLDNDSFPIATGWLDVLVSSLENGAAIAGVWRDEMSGYITPFVHVSCLCIRARDLARLGFTFSGGQDVGQELTDRLVAEGGATAKLRRTNAVNDHFLMGGVYGNLIYHQGAGSRRPKFWKPTDAAADERVRLALRDAAFSDIDSLVERLTATRYEELEPTVDAG